MSTGAKLAARLRGSACRFPSPVLTAWSLGGRTVANKPYNPSPVTALTSTGQQPPVLGRHEGWILFTAAEALVKGALEADSTVELIAGPRSDPFASLFAAERDEAVAALLAAHGTLLLPTPDAGRAVTLAEHRAVSGKRALALVPNDQLERTLPVIDRIRGSSLERGGAVCVVLEDDPGGRSSASPHRAAVALDLPCLQPGDVGGVRDGVERALRLSRAARRPAAMVVHRWILRSEATIEARPNRVVEPAAAVAVPQRRRVRRPETGGVLRVARRLELNRIRSLPSPGEHLPVGFIVTGPAAPALDHVIDLLRLHGRVPVLDLGLVHPFDDSVVQRMLGRCEKVVVLEPRPGGLEPEVLRAAELIRRRGERCGAVYTTALDDERGPLKPNEVLHPSRLARRIVHLLHSIRPGLEIPFVPDPPVLAQPPAPRGQTLGAGAALAVVREILADVDQWLRDQAPGEDGVASPDDAPTALVIDGVEPETLPAGERVAAAETWSYRRFRHEGAASIRQAAWDDRPWLFVICAVGADDPREVERLARAAIPGDRAEGVKVETVDLGERGRLRDTLRSLTQSARVGIVIANDGPPPRFDVNALERARAEIDRLGFEPRQRVVAPMEDIGAIRQAPGFLPTKPPLEPDPIPLRTRLSVGRLAKTRKGGGQFRLRVRPLLESVEVVRDRPPATAWGGATSAKLPLPQPLHGHQSQWRAHLAGFRGPAPGVAARVLSFAGRAMGYQVRCLHDPAPIGPGRRAWAQVLFTQPRRDQTPLPITARIPFGEADLLLGFDDQEALRAIDPGGDLQVANRDRTCAVVNLERFADEVQSAERAPAAHALRAVTRDGHRLLERFAGAVRSLFHTDRVTDLVIMGSAYQLGMVPLSLEAMEAALQQVEPKGFGRTMEAFRFGRHLAVSSRMLTRPRDEPETPGADDVEELVRRTLLLLRCGWWGARLDVAQFGALLRRTLAAMPGLSETDPGRRARRDLVVALHRCLSWGGFEYARRYADLVTELYRADRGDKGRAVTRNAILPLAEAMLIRDPIYEATLVVGPEQRARIRRLLNVKLARGDRLERRFLTRIEVVALQRRFRWDVRFSDWAPVVAAVARHRIPQRWRGTAVERRIRERVIDVVEQAARGAASDYARWSEIIQRLHDQAADGRLRGMALSELSMLIEK
jgi:Pyruvate/2-oxoacid:ferredoxin oxidoreductase gamma subunit